MLVIETYAVWSFALAATSITVTKAKVTEPMRQWVQARSAWFGKLITCHYCFSHWVAVGMAPWTGIQVLDNWFANLAIVTMSLVGASALIVRLIME